MGSGKKGKPAAVMDQDSVFATVPSRTEVEKAISELQRCKLLILLPSIYCACNILLKLCT